jgi:predicted negative regulator of RcsB-dependent stress response
MKKYIPIIILIVLIGVGLFYWYEWKPAQIRQRQYEACLDKCDSAFPDIIIELKELNAMYLQTCKLECKEKYAK